MHVAAVETREAHNDLMYRIHGNVTPSDVTSQKGESGANLQEPCAWERRSQDLIFHFAFGWKVLDPATSCYAAKAMPQRNAAGQWTAPLVEITSIQELEDVKP